MTNITRILKEKATSLHKGYRSPLWWRNVTIKYISMILPHRHNGFPVTSENWDHLIILDACRFDVFSEEIRKTRIYEQGTLEYRISMGSMTKEFLLKNFGRGNFKDIVYITANPFVDMLLKGRFYKIIPVWKYGWDDKLNTVHPKTLYEYTLYAMKKYPNKRFIVHFMQPHFPYITLRIKEETGFSKHREAVLTGKTHWDDKTIWDLVIENRIPLEIVKKAYRENLRIALKYVEPLVRKMDGKIIITSDHGEAFGEPLSKILPIKVYGHPERASIEILRKVPWFIIQKPKKPKRKVEEAKIKHAIDKLKRQL